jgi:hypothetical protein
VACVAGQGCGWAAGLSGGPYCAVVGVLLAWEEECCFLSLLAGTFALLAKTSRRLLDRCARVRCSAAQAAGAAWTREACVSHLTFQHQSLHCWQCVAAIDTGVACCSSRRRSWNAKQCVFFRRKLLARWHGSCCYARCRIVWATIMEVRPNSSRTAATQWANSGDGKLWCTALQQALPAGPVPAVRANGAGQLRKSSHTLGRDSAQVTRHRHWLVYQRQQGQRDNLMSSCPSSTMAWFSAYGSGVMRSVWRSLR